ncbi:SDR family NAD(P)-dependent oxidoreductase [Kitasatospora purpeofusca]|uniref:SDR family NAD(P)-dependent oxidoreductase n=1 Tax=Kitasatospora purpeofusca TaxID=67352 RepID=UPI00224E8320|nr:SDR family NAD(P)-dependent oxidoreductase [Kitasatospora purpeofusca]MCX4757908.1 SDR family oxidoreductase [Kitasatospora purpeofusca]WSR31605.1 SDR family oxidoreductase [Kitasatospora purpeofusca]WSR39629.1 SDR family oxidoreductase [Kitasatospora purpeofusca]
MTVRDDTGTTTGEITPEELAAFSRTLGRLRALPIGDRTRLHAERQLSSFHRESRKQRRQEERAGILAADAELLAATATGAPDRREDAPLAPAPVTPASPAPVGSAPLGELRGGRRCYVCKQRYREVDAFYHMLCRPCAADNTARRGLSTDLRGRRALLTGGRVKIGFQLALMMLRDGAELLVTSRFPHDTVRRFRAAEGSAAWWDRLTVVGIDLRDPRQVLGLTEQLRTEGRPLDILVNNAAQTLRRPPESYALLAAGERSALPSADAATVTHAPGFRPMPALAPAWPTTELASPTPAPTPLPAPPGADEAGLLPDLAATNSWSARLGSLDPAELLEVQLVNALAPALLCDRLLPLLLASPHPRRYIVNVTAVEGRFAVRNKTAGHPHTNMAKAALNMLTRTSAEELATRGVHMCAVDTGWITDENPAPRKARIAATGFRTPLDIVDGAARVYDPVVRGEAGSPVSGVFLKDYREAAW